eukprot:UN17299
MHEKYSASHISSGTLFSVRRFCIAALAPLHNTFSMFCIFEIKI